MKKLIFDKVYEKIKFILSLINQLTKSATSFSTPNFPYKFSNFLKAVHSMPLKLNYIIYKTI